MNTYNADVPGNGDPDGDQSDKNGNKGDGSNTGDETNLIIYLMTMITSLLLILVVFIGRRKRRA